MRARKQIDWRGWLRAEGARLYSEEEGATLIFAAVTFFAMTIAIAFVYQVGVVSADRLQMQGAADSAAYSGALVQANSLNAIGQINDGLVYVNYIALRHVVDITVYAIALEQYPARNFDPPATGSRGFVIMGGSGGRYEGNARIDYIKGLSGSAQTGLNAKYLRDLVNWSFDLHNAARTVARSTPHLVRASAGEIAQLNGASHIGFATNLDGIWNFEDDEISGFSEKAYANSDDEFAPAMYERYEGRKVQQITDKVNGRSEAKARSLPPSQGADYWFNARTGKLDGHYYQIRLCWHKDDWEHNPTASKPPNSEHEVYPGGAPNAHWHHGHAHNGIFTIDGSPAPQALRHSGGQLVTDVLRRGGGHGQPDDAPNGEHEGNAAITLDPNELSRPDWPHHAVYPCQVCARFMDNDFSPQPRPGWGNKYSEVAASTKLYGEKWASNFLNQFFEQKRGPLVLKEELLRSSVTVVTYRPARGMSTLFPASPWGMLAVASAQVGVQTDRGVTPLQSLSNGRATYAAGGGTVPYHTDSGSNSNSKADRNQNLFYDRPGGKEGVHFSARLVPVGRELTWHPKEVDGSGLRKILSGTPTGEYRWYAARAITPSSSGQLESPGEVREFEKFFRVGSQKDLETFWH